MDGLPHSKPISKRLVAHDLHKGLRHPWLPLSFLIFLTIIGCTTTGDDQSGGRSSDYGVQLGLEGFVPARIAIVPCQGWPSIAYYPGRRPMNAPQSALELICKKYDEFVLQGFDRQPYMKGLSPKFVEKSLALKKLPLSNEIVGKLWAKKAGPCSGCANPPQFYTFKIATLPEWEIWVGQVSQAARSADALLMPMVVSLEESRYADRGIVVAERAAQVSLFLIDTASGKLLWAGGRQVFLPEKRLSSGPGSVDAAGLEPPPWDDVAARLFVEPLWQDFPGRKTL